MPIERGRRQKIARSSRFWPLLLALALAACVGKSARLSEEKAIDIAWGTLEPYTSSHELSDWEVIEARKVSGQEAQEVADSLADRSGPGCIRPDEPAKAEVSPSGTYWLIRMQARPATPVPREESLGTTAQPPVPEPLADSATFLIGGDSRDVVASTVFCPVVY